MDLSAQQALWLAAALDHTDADRGVLSTAELQLFARYVTLSDASGRSAASNAELVVGLSARRLGQRAGRKAFSGANGARRSLEQRGLIACDRTATGKRHVRTGAVMVTPWSVTITIDCDHVRPFAWSSAPEWIVRMLGDGALPAHARQIALWLARALRTDGAFDATRKELAEVLGVHRDTALKGLRLLEARGHLSLHERQELRRATVFTITATNASTVAISSASQRTVVTKAAAPAPVAALQSSRHRVITDPLIEFEANGQAVLRAAVPTPAVSPTEVAASPAPVIVEPMRLTITPDQFNADWFADLRTTCVAFPGTTPVMLIVPDGTEKPLKTGPGGAPITIELSAAFDAAFLKLQQGLSLVAAAHSELPATEPEDDDGFDLACEQTMIENRLKRLSVAA
jgi:hypothetical protein